LFRQRVDSGQDSLPPLTAGHMVFPARTRVWHQIRQGCLFVDRLLNLHADLAAPFQGLIVGHAERPGAEILPRSPQLQVPAQRKEHILDNVLSVLDRKTEADHIAEQSISQLLEKADHLFH
jgi:hypothetical protein